MSENTVEIPVQDRGGREVEKVSVDLALFDKCRRRQLLKDAVVMYLANRRVGTHDTKTRAEIRGSQKKPWRQKGTGRARAGSRKSPIWRGGGVAFGPHPRDYRQGLNRKMRRRALRSALFSKLKDGQVRVVDSLEMDSPKTKVFADLLGSLGIEGRCLVGISKADRNLYLSSRNVPGVKLIPVSDFNAYDVLVAKTVLLTRESLEILKNGGGDS